jgi:hypothetical protein
LSWCIYWFVGGRIVFSKSYSVSESSQERCLLLRQSLKTKCSLEIPSLWVLNWLTGKVDMSHELQLLLCSVIVSFVTAKQKLASNYFKLPFNTSLFFFGYGKPSTYWCLLSGKYIFSFMGIWVLIVTFSHMYIVTHGRKAWTHMKCGSVCELLCVAGFVVTSQWP